MRWGWWRPSQQPTDLALALARGRWNPAGPLAEIPFVVFDTETTGFHPFAGDEIIAIAARRVDTGTEFATLVNPGRPIPQLATDVTGIDNAMVQSAPEPLAALVAFLRFAGRSVLVAHCADFDRAFVEVRLRKAEKLRWVHPLLDTMALARALFPAWADYRLEHCASRLQIPVVGRHTAAGDSCTTQSILLALLAECRRRGLHTWSDLSAFLHTRRVW